MDYQARRKLVTDEQVKEFTAIRPMNPFSDLKKPQPAEKEEVKGEKEGKKEAEKEAEKEGEALKSS